MRVALACLSSLFRTLYHMLAGLLYDDEPAATAMRTASPDRFDALPCQMLKGAQRKPCSSWTMEVAIPARSLPTPAAFQVSRGLSVGRLLARGAFARVYECRDGTGEACVLKILVCDRALYDFKREVKLMGEMQPCPHVIGCKSGLVAVAEPESGVVRPAIVLEDGGTCLQDLIERHVDALESAKAFATTTPPKASVLTEKIKVNLLQQMVYGVQHLHVVVGVCHRDLKPENMTVDAAGVLRLVDFGLARFLDEGEANDGVFKEAVGTKPFAAPEVLREELYDGRIADAWSLGVTAFALFFHFLPVEVAVWNLDWRFRAMSKYQVERSPHPLNTVAYILGWYKRENQVAMTSHRVVKFIDALLVVEPSSRSRVRFSTLVGA